MRKQLWGLAAISLLLGATSCTEETIETINDGKNQIEFKTALGKQAVTRVAEFTNASWAQGAKLKVESYYAGTKDKFEEFELTNAAGGTGEWAVNKTINQPGSMLNYFSFFPTTGASVSPIATANQYPFTYTVGSVDDQVDLIAAAVKTNKSDVTLTFKHALSQVNFAVQAMPGVEIKISDLKVNKVFTKGTCTLEAGKDPVWSDRNTSLGDGESYAYPLNNSTEDAGTKLLAAGTSTAVVDLMQTNGALMLLPQTFSTENDGTFSFKVSLTIDGNGDGDFEDTEDTKKAENITVKANLCDFQTTEWLPGKRYKYVIDFSSYLAGGPITFKVDVADWENDIDVTTVETLHVPDATALSIEAAIAKHSAANATFNKEEADKKTKESSYTVRHLTRFPISVTKDPTSTVTITSIIGFDPEDDTDSNNVIPADIIIIEFPTSDGADNLEVKVPGWTPDKSGRVVTLTCVSPITEAQVAPNLRVATDENKVVTEDTLKAAITLQSKAKNDNSDFTVFPITVPEGIPNSDSDPSITITDATLNNFAAGDRIRIICTDAASAGKIAISTENWDLAAYDNIVIIDRKQ